MTITEADGSTVVLPIGLHLQLWDSALLAAYVGQIIIKEALGLNVVVVGGSINAQPGALGVIGCFQTDLRVIVCPEGPVAANHPHHISPEIWIDVGWRQEDFEALNMERTPYYFEAGYHGEEGQYVNLEVHDAALKGKGWHLDFYGDFDSQWKDPWSFFDNTSAIPFSKLKLCREGELGSLPMMDLVKRHTPDPDGFTAEGLAYCEDSYWWRSPTCRLEPERCIPLVTGGSGWMVTEMMQRAIAYSMPIALGVANTFSDYQELALSYRIMYYTWEPALHFLMLDPQKIIFPTHDAVAFAEGDGRTQGGETQLFTMVNPRLRDGSERAHRFLSAMRLTRNQIKDLLVLLHARPDEHEQSACDWLLNNSDTWHAWLPLATNCLAGEGLIDRDGAFQVQRSTATGCGPCSPGYYSTEYSDLSGDSYICLQCPPGTSQGAYRAESCEECGAGYFQVESGRSACERCPKGGVATGTGNSECLSCPDGKTTDGTGFRSLDDCLCPRDTFELPSTGECFPCGPGSFCRGFGAEPVAEAGYYLGEVSQDGLSIFSCAHNPQRCPGGPVGTCAVNRQGPSCSECVEGTTPANGGTCSRCVSSDNLPAIAVATCLGIALTLLYIYNCQERSHKQSHTSLFLITVMAQLLSVLQMVGVTTRISVDWPGSMKAIVAVFQRVTFEFDDMVQIGCLASVSSIARYCLKLTIVPIICAFLLLLHGLVSAGWRSRSWRRGFPAVVSSIGIVVMAFYITISTLILTPFQCMEHPNGLWTLIQYSSITCWTSTQHQMMVVVGMLAASIPVSFVAGVAYVLWDFPYRMARGDKTYIRMYAFILVRVKPERRWYIFLSLCRNLFLVLVPCIPDAFRQTLFLQVVFIISLAVIVREMPWKLNMANYLDLLSTFAVLFVLLTSAAFLDAGEDEQMSEVALWTLVQLFSIFPLVILWALLNRIFNFWMHPKRYRWFLCHHKGTSGNFARLLKLTLTSEAKHLGGQVFLDVDDLCDLGELFLVVRDDVRTLIVIATPEVFRSPWCLGEVTTAFLHNVDTLPLHAPDFTMGDGWVAEAAEHAGRLSKLVENELTHEDVQLALEAFRLRQHLLIPESIADSSVKTLVKSVTYRDATTTRRWSASRAATIFGSHRGPEQASRSEESDVLVLVDLHSSEAVSAALAFVKLANRLLPPNPAQMPQVLGVYGTRSFEGRPGGGPVVVIVFFTGGCFNCRDFLWGLVEAVMAQVNHVLPIVASDDFQFPGSGFYDDLATNLDQMIGAPGGGGGGGGGGSVAAAADPHMLAPFLQSIFNRICPRLSTSSSADVLQVQIQLVVRSLLDSKCLALHEQGVSSTQMQKIMHVFQKVRGPSQVSWRSTDPSQSSHGTLSKAFTREDSGLSKQQEEMLDPDWVIRPDDSRQSEL